MKEKLKNIKIDKRVHDRLKMFCDEHSLKMFKFVERLIIENCKLTGKQTEDIDIYGEKN